MNERIILFCSPFGVHVVHHVLRLSHKMLINGLTYSL